MGEKDIRPRIAPGTSVRQRPDGSPVFTQRRYTRGETDNRNLRANEQVRYLKEIATNDKGAVVTGVDAIRINDQNKGFQG